MQKDFYNFLNEIIPLKLAEEWDPVGLSIGNSEKKINTIMTCLTITLEVVEEAKKAKVDLIITHHPFPFRPLKKILTNTAEGKILKNLLEFDISVYSPHTAYDNCSLGINEQLAEKLLLKDIKPLVLHKGRFGMLEAPLSFKQFSLLVKNEFQLPQLLLSGDEKKHVQKVAVSCGSGGYLINAAIDNRSDVFVSGELSLHQVLELKSEGICVILLGHHESEAFALDLLSHRIKDAFPKIDAFKSSVDSSPFLNLI